MSFARSSAFASIAFLCVLISFSECVPRIHARASAPWSLLFGLTPNVALENINVQTGKPVEVSTKLAYEAQGQGLATMDPVNGIYYMVGTNISSRVIALVGISCTTGLVVSETPLPFLLEVFVGIGQFAAYDSKMDEVLVVGRDPDVKNQHVILRVKPQTGRVRMVAKVGDFSMLELLGGVSAFDPFADILWFQLALNDSGRIFIRFYGYDGTTGMLLNVLDNPKNLGNLAFDAKSGLLYGIGLQQDQKSGAWVRTVVAMNSLTGTFTTLSTIPDYVNMMSAIGTIDQQNRVFYALMHNSSVSASQLSKFNSAEQLPFSYGLVNLQMKAGSQSPTLPSMDLVGINIDTGKILTHPEACSQFPNCPWSIEYLNPIF